VLGPVAAPLLFFAPVGIGLYLVSGSLLLPGVVAILVGAAVVVQLPAIGVNVVGIALIMLVALGAFALILRLNRNR